MTISVENKAGLSGEFKITVKRKDGSIKFDSGFQKNMILDNAIKYFLHIDGTLSNGKNSYFNGKKRWGVQDNHILYGCVVGSGNTPPKASDIALENFESLCSHNSKILNHKWGIEQPTEDLHPGYIKLWESKKYIFDDINNKNITEIGLINWSGSYKPDAEDNGDNISGNYPDSYRPGTVYRLMTRALIKESNGDPISVTVLEGEVLEVTYKINAYYDIKRQNGSFNLAISNGDSETVEEFEYFMQPIFNGSYATTSSQISYNDSTVKSYGVKEADSELDSSYDLADEEWNKLNHKDTSAIVKKTKDHKASGISYGRSKYHAQYLEIKVLGGSFEHKHYKVELINGIYTHDYENGIRAFSISLSNYEYFVVLKNKKNGQGIKKTNRQLWSIETSFSIDRWEE